VEWDELKVHDTVICTSYISSGKHFFKPALPEKPAGTVGGSKSLNPDNSNSHEFELHRPSNKGTKLLLKVIKAIIIIRLEIAGSLVQDFWTAIGYGRVPEFFGRLRNKGHRLIARSGGEILLETSGNQRTWGSISGWEQWQWQRALESRLKQKP